MFKQTKKRILVVEDDKLVLNGIQDILQLENFLVLGTMDAHAAALVIDSFCPDTVVLGFVFSPDTQQSHLISYCRYLYPIVYLCYRSYAARLSESNLLTEEDEVLTKSFHAEELLEAISRILAKQDSP
jgi:DNA-binding response OmpR family regulator